MGKEYRICTRCVMDTSDKDITFDEKGICNHCKLYYEKLKKVILTGKAAEKKLREITEEIKARGSGKKYNCILGLSGGTDSTFMAYIAKKLDLNPLIVHLDNGWNSRISVHNIKNVVKKLGFDLFTYVIDWDEFRELQLAYLRASVIDIEILTDHAIKAILFQLASNHNVKYILNGTNTITEGIMPNSWVYDKNDLVNLKDIIRKFGRVKIKTFPTLGISKQIYYDLIKKIRSVQILDYVSYIKDDAKKTLKEELEWKDYGDKHGESIFTNFYQKYILPEKFKIDKRRIHLSPLICSGQISREYALKELENPPYKEENLKIDMEYVLKKLKLSENEFKVIMELPVKDHREFKNTIRLKKFIKSFQRLKKQL